MSRDEIVQLLKDFEQARPHLEAALARDITGTWSLESVKERVMTGDLQLWLGDGFAAITEIVNHPDRRLVHVHLAGGEKDKLVLNNDDLVKFAKMVGATGISVVGRKGWARVLKDKGYSEAAVYLFREV